ncbi:MAG TPA: phosphatase PAP2 family protein [Chloroflexota bacterium]|nr:phosphatase PAP2 family protein [Chloroflexota bacterium]
MHNSSRKAAPAGRTIWLWLVVFVAAFAGLTWVALTSPPLRVDIDVERAVQAYHPAWLETLTEAISWLGFPPQSTIIDAVIVLAIFLTGRRWEAVCAAVAAAGSAGLWFLLTPLVHRPRPTPDLVRVVFELPSGGFPSGHVLNLTAFFGFLAFLAMSQIRPGPVRTLCVAACVALVVAIGFARIYSGQHWPTDVFAGYVLGAAWLLLSISLYRWRMRRSGAVEPAVRSR